jgi:hypothetical protein
MSRPDLRRRAPTRTARLGAALLLATSCALGQAAAVDPDDDRIGELMGNLMFHADLLVSLERLCPGTASTQRDWQAVVRQLPSQVRTRELRELSLRLSANAGVAMVRSNGGCGTRDFVRSYEDTRREYEALLEQWARLSV